MSARTILRGDRYELLIHDRDNIFAKHLDESMGTLGAAHQSRPPTSKFAPSLRTDYIDLYQIHWPDPLVPIEEVAAELQGMYREGKIRAIGVNNFNPAQLDAFRAIAPLHTVQPPYSLFERGIDVDVLPYAARSGLSVLAYGALCRGLLTGRITAQTQFSGDDLRRSDPKFANAQRRTSCLSAVHALDAFGAMGWRLDAEAMTSIDRILERNIATPLGAEFMAPPPRSAATGEPSPTAAATAYAK